MPVVDYSASPLGLKIVDLTLLADAASIDSGAVIPADFDMLDVWILGRTTEATDVSTCNVRVNNDSGANYDRQSARGNNVTASAFGSFAGVAWVLSIPGANQQAGAAGIIHFTIPGYAQTVFHKSGTAQIGVPDDTAANNFIDNMVFRWRNTAAINRVSVAAASGNMLTGSRLLIYAR